MHHAGLPAPVKGGLVNPMTRQTNDAVAAITLNCQIVLMHYMLFEIWGEPGEHSSYAGVVHPQNDKAHASKAPTVVLRHAFRAYSDRDFWRQFFCLDDRGEWEPWTDLPEYFFTEAEVEEQERYLQIRNLDGANTI